LAAYWSLKGVNMAKHDDINVGMIGKSPDACREGAAWVRVEIEDRQEGCVKEAKGIYLPQHHFPRCGPWPAFPIYAVHPITRPSEPF
jgi:hypothetical protein